MRSRARAYGSAVAAMALILAACGGDDADDDTAEEPQTEAPTDGEEPSGEPIVIGSTLSLTGAFGPTGAIHQIVGEQFVERLNENGGLLGRPVEWQLLDDESDSAQVTQLYERLINQDQVDLVIGPYATPNIIPAVAVAERAGYMMPQHTAIHAPLLTYQCQFPGWSMDPVPDEYTSELLFEMLAGLPDPPQTIALVTNESGSTQPMTEGFVEQGVGQGMLGIAPEYDLEVVADLRYPPGNQEWGSIATQLRDADADIVINNGLAVDPVGIVEAMAQLDYQPPMFFTLFPAPGPILGLGENAEGVLSVSLFEPNEPILEQYGDEVREITEEFSQRATDAGLPYTVFESQAAASWNAWEILVGAVEGADTLEQEALCDYLVENGVDTTLNGHLTFDPEQHNFWESNVGIKQVQNGDWVMVWPEDRAAADVVPPGN
ncbi:MAG TPA: amino acid ABC transporter substrate-binding protein [Jiangellaceae bacterium]|nr:amino acid ABC transporter substrate-binding protein [Jiangellaceae bacterium]